MKIFMAARHARQLELQGYATDLLAMGHEVVSSWVWDARVIADKEIGARYALEDFEALTNADLLIFFSERQRIPTGGGRHTELGIALGRGIRVMLVGPQENVYHSLPSLEIEPFESWTDAWGQLYYEWQTDYYGSAAVKPQEPVAGPPGTDFEWHRQATKALKNRAAASPGTTEQYILFADDLYAEACELFEVGNREYSNGQAWTSNFDTAAHFLRMSLPGAQPRDTALVYLMKSIFSIAKGHTERQDMRSRYLDAINYLTFMAWMDEHEHEADMMTSHAWDELEEANTEPEPSDLEVEVPVEWPVYNNAGSPPLPKDAFGPTKT